MRYLKNLILGCTAIAVFAMSELRPLMAQVAASSAGAGQSLWIGADYSNIHADFPYGSNLRLSGIGASSVFNWNHHLGIEGSVIFNNFNTFYGEKEQSFLAGPRYTFFHSEVWKPYAMLELGDAKLTYPFTIGTYNYFALSPGAGIEYQLRSHWSLKAEYRYEFLRNAPDFANEAQYGIRPNGFNVGVGYRLKLWNNPNGNK